jgi:hypothetical protein
MDVRSEISAYEVNGEVVPDGNVRVAVRSHRIDHDFVVLEIDDRSVTVAARQLKAAVDNAQNAPA